MLRSPAARARDWTAVTPEAGPESSVSAARAILDANAELEKAIAESLYAEKVAWYEKRIRQIESRTLAEGERLFKGAVSDVTGEGLLSRGRLS